MAVAVASSGGRDSTALLHLVARQAPRWGLRVVALHVHHGLMPEADQWQSQVRQQARRFCAAFATERLQGAPASGESVEAWARKMRYAALVRLAHSERCPLVLLAQHRRDQAETFLIQALRGGGAAGLAAMPASFVREGITFARPWLNTPRESIEAYVKQHRLRHVEDMSNADPRFARGRWRALWPALLQAFPDAEVALARAAERASAESALVAEIAAGDLVSLTGDRPKAAGGAQGSAMGPEIGETPLKVPAWLTLSPARRTAALRAWLARVMTEPPPETLVRRLLAELPDRHVGRWHAGEASDLVLRRTLLTIAPAAPRRVKLTQPSGAAAAGSPGRAGTSGRAKARP